MRATEELIASLPQHLRKYVVDQNYDRYTWQDQGVWRLSLRLLRDFLSVHAHEAYVPGLPKTGLSVEAIPKIDDMSLKLQEFGWRAVPVSGFIPPAAFMELQSLSILPIASDIRTLDHLDYTPAPDIIHEAAGHAPILVDPAFSEYLREYAQLAKRAIMDKKDLDQYEAIRVLSDLKESPLSSPEEIKAAEKRLEEINHNMGDETSEAGLLSRMNWWTAEYGLIGSLKSPKIFGAGLLSSLGESRTCLEYNVKKIPLSLECINYSYDITEKQPQLFVAESFEHLKVVLRELSEILSYRRGGTYGLRRAHESQTVNTVVLESGLQISGLLSKFIKSPSDSEKIAYLQFSGPCQLSEEDSELSEHGVNYHSVGYGTAIGRLRGASKPLSKMTQKELANLGIRWGQKVSLQFDSGVLVEGYLKSWLKGSQDQLLVLTFEDCKVVMGSEVLFNPEWGTYDLGIGEDVVSVFGGPADRPSFGETESFAAKIIPLKALSQKEKDLNQLFFQAKELKSSQHPEPKALESLFNTCQQVSPNNWLLHLELYELAQRIHHPLSQQLEDLLRKAAKGAGPIEPFVVDGIALAQRQERG